MKAEPDPRELLQAQFNRLRQERTDQQQLPAGLRREVFDTLSQVDDAADVTDLFNADCERIKPEFFDRIEPGPTDKQEQ